MFSGAIRRITALVVGLVMGISALTLIASGPAEADDGPTYDGRPFTDALGWLNAHVSKDSLIQNDVDLTWRLAMYDPTGAMADAVRSHFDDYVGPLADAPTARLARAVQIGQGIGRDVAPLVNELVSRLVATGPAAGRFADRGAGSPAYVDTVGQALGAYALALGGSPDADAARAFLREQQCDGGGFRPQPADLTASEQACHGDAPRTRASVLATGEALRGLQRGIFTSQGDWNAFEHAGEWLTAQQKQDGSFGDLGRDVELLAEVEPGMNMYEGGGYGAPGLGQAATAWLRALQAHDAGACTTGLHDQTGAVAPDPAALDRAQRAGIAPADLDAWVRSTALSLPALGDAPDVFLFRPWRKDVDLARPGSSRVRGGSHVVLNAGVNPGDSMCLTGPRTKSASTGYVYGRRSMTVLTPKGTSRVTYTLENSLGERDAVTLDVLGARTLHVALGRHRVHRGHRVHVSVSGLAPRERLTLRYRGVVVRHATAGTGGRYRTTLAVGKKRGRHAVTVVGMFVDRHGRASLRVIA